MLKKERDKVPKLFAELMAQYSEDMCYHHVNDRFKPNDSYSLVTIAGTMTVQLIPSNISPWLACRFTVPQIARHRFDCNPFSGKFNCHISGCETAEQLVKQFRLHINRTLI